MQFTSLASLDDISHRGKLDIFPGQLPSQFLHVVFFFPVSVTPTHLNGRDSVGDGHILRFGFNFPVTEMTAPHASQETLSTAASQISVFHGSPTTPGSFQFSTINHDVPTSSDLRVSDSHGHYVGRTGTIQPRGMS